jgi:PhzF family phenazine biosynthesis protein
MTPSGRRRVIRHVDAFTATPLEGNPAAVVDGEGIDDATMQRIALNQKLSETVFLLPPESADNHARLRIFTPAVELPFAGHPTLAAAHILVSEAIVKLAEGETLRLETGAGIIPLEIAGDPPLYTMTQVEPKFRDCEHSLIDIAGWIGLDPGDVVRAEHVSTGIYWLIAQIASLETMMRVRPDTHAMQKHDISIFCIGAQSPGPTSMCARSRRAVACPRTRSPAAATAASRPSSRSTACCRTRTVRSATSPSRASRWDSRGVCSQASAGRTMRCRCASADTR